MSFYRIGASSGRPYHRVELFYGGIESLKSANDRFYRLGINPSLVEIPRTPMEWIANKLGDINGWIDLTTGTLDICESTSGMLGGAE